jgi:probable addiction module antidote protein
MGQTYRTLDEHLKSKLANRDRARGYLQLALEEFEQDGDMEAFLTALRSVAQAQGGIAHLAAESGLSRQHLYKALSKKGNPQLGTLSRLLRSLGYRIYLVEAPPGLQGGG